jgi:hypothetical protein
MLNQSMNPWAGTGTAARGNLGGRQYLNKGI